MQFIFEFQEDGIYIEDYSACDPGSNSVYKSKWSINDAETVLTISGQPVDIEFVEETRMSVSFTDDDNGMKIKQTAVYVRK